MSNLYFVVEIRTASNDIAQFGITEYVLARFPVRGLRKAKALAKAMDKDGLDLYCPALHTEVRKGSAYGETVKAYRLKP